jgi:hypothetical protein
VYLRSMVKSNQLCKYRRADFVWAVCAHVMPCTPSTKDIKTIKIDTLATNFAKLQSCISFKGQDHQLYVSSAVNRLGTDSIRQNSTMTQKEGVPL